MIKAGRLGYVAFETPDLDKAVDHYLHVVGLHLAGREARRVYLATKLGQLAVVLEQGGAARCTRLSFEVAGLDCGEGIRTLARHGIAGERRSDPFPGVSEALSFQDPKGTTIDLFLEWKTVSRPDAVAGAGVLKLGHVAFVVPDPQAMAEFYQAVLGFRVSDWIEDFFVFLRCNADHHAVNFIRGEPARLHHFAFEVKDFAQLEEACDLLGKKGIAIAWGPVRLGPGHNVAIFHRNPDDQMIEFYAELDQMKSEDLGYWDPRPWHRECPQRPKVWTGSERYIWGPPPTPDFVRAERSR